MLQDLLNQAQAHAPAAIDWLRAIIGGGVGVFVLTEAAKRWNAIPLSAGQTGKLRATAGGLAIVASLLTAAADQNLSPDLLQQLILAALTAISAHVMHKGNKALSASLGKEG